MKHLNWALCSNPACPRNASGIFHPKNLKQNWLPAVWNEIKTHKWLKRTLIVIRQCKTSVVNTIQESCCVHNVTDSFIRFCGANPDLDPRTETGMCETRSRWQIFHNPQNGLPVFHNPQTGLPVFHNPQTGLPVFHNPQTGLPVSHNPQTGLPVSHSP